MNRTPQTHHMDWNGLTLEITYVPQYMPARLAGEDLARLEVRSLDPTHAALPIAPNGFYAHALPASIIAAAGGPVAYVDVMLDAEAFQQEHAA